MNALLSMVRTGGVGDEIASLLINKQQNEGSMEEGSERGSLFNEMILFLFFFFFFFFFFRLITVLDHPNHHYSTVNVNVIFKVKVLLSPASIVLKFHAPKMSLNRQLIKHCHR